ncbi:MAG: hypothetical protein Q4A68_08665 [Anaerobiospirillum succiniciproducens]|uniref:hypothetical protein n=1 Tax=Anaerobiospirillum succiniciproducens TaxID=13335 RepID=UPI0026DD7E87|nr:hypothetical protein [Anaerobiospirillum succiniciproducens]MDO4676624.1 hypothetical protein [Anaerobiospirillum succiniciproducens]
MATNDDKLQNLINRAISDYAYGQEDEVMDKASLERLSQIVNAQEPVAQKKVDIFGDGVNGVNVNALRVALQGYNDVKPNKYSSRKSDFQSAKASVSSNQTPSDQGSSASFESTLNPTLTRGAGHLNSSANDNSVAPAAGIVSQGELAPRTNSHTLGNQTSSQANSLTGAHNRTSSSAYDNRSHGTDDYNQIGLRSKNNLLGSHHVPVDYQEQFGSELGKTHDRLASQAALDELDSMQVRQDPAFKDFITPQLMERNQRAAQIKSATAAAHATAAQGTAAHGTAHSAADYSAKPHDSASHSQLNDSSNNHAAMSNDQLPKAMQRPTQSYRYTSASLQDGPFSQASSATKVQIQVGYTPKAQAQAQAQAQTKAQAAAHAQEQAPADTQAHASAAQSSVASDHERANVSDKYNEDELCKQFSSATHISVSSPNSSVNNQARYIGNELYTRQSSSTIITKMDAVSNSALANSSDEQESYAAPNTSEQDQSVKREDAVQSHSEKDFDVNSFSAITSATTGRKAYAAQRAAHMQGSYVAPSIMDTHASTQDDGAQGDAQNDAAYSYTNRMSRSNSRSAVSPQIGRQAPRANTKLNAVSFGPAAAIQAPQSGQYISAVNPYEQTQIEAAKQVNESYGLMSNTGFGALTHEYDAHRSAGSVLRKNINKKQSMRDIAGYAVQNDYGFSSPASRSNGAFKTSDTNDLRDASAVGDQLIQRAVNTYERIPAQSQSTLIVRSKTAVVQDEATVFVTASGNKTIVGIESSKPVVPLKTAQVQKSESLEAEAAAEAFEEEKLEELSEELASASEETQVQDHASNEQEPSKALAQDAESHSSDSQDSQDQASDDAAQDAQSADPCDDGAADADKSEADNAQETKSAREVVTAIVRDASYEVKYAQKQQIASTEQSASPTRIIGVVNEVPERQLPTDAVRIVRSKAAAFTPSLEGNLAAAHGTIFSEQEFKGSVIGNTPAEFLKAKPSASNAQDENKAQSQDNAVDSDLLENELLVGNTSTRIVTSSQRLKQNFARSTKLTEDLEAKKREEEAKKQQEEVPTTIISVHDFMHKIELTAAQALAAAQASANAYAMIEADSEVTEARAGKNYGFAETSLILPKSGQENVNTGEEHIPDYAKVPIQIHAEPKHRKVAKATAPADAQVPAQAAEQSASAQTPATHVAAVPSSAPATSAPAPEAKVAKDAVAPAAEEPVKAQETVAPVKEESKAEQKAEPKVEQQTESQPEPKVEQKVEPKAEQQTESQVEPKAEIVADTKLETAPEQKTEQAQEKIETAAQEQNVEVAVESIVTDDSNLEIKVKRHNKHNKNVAEQDMHDSEPKGEETAEVAASEQGAATVVTPAQSATETNVKPQAAEAQVEESKAEESKVSTIVYQQDEEVPYVAAKAQATEDFDDPVKAASAAVREALHAQAEANNSDVLRNESAEALSGSAVDSAAAVPEHNLLEGVSADTDLTSSDEAIDKVVDLGKVSDGPIASEDVVMSALSQGASKDYDIVDTKQVIKGNRKNRNRNSRKRR